MTLKEMIKHEGYTNREFCQIARISEYTLYKMMKGNYTTYRQTDTFFRVARILGITEKELRMMTRIKNSNTHPLKQAIEEKGMTMRDFCFVHDLPYETVIGIVSGKVRKPRVDTLVWLADALQMPVERLHG